MKKFKVLALVMVLILTISVLAACGNKTTPVTTPTPAPTVEPAPAPAPTPAVEGYKDGVYKVSYDKADARDWKAQVEVEIKDAKIVNVVFDYVNKDGKLKSQDEAYKAAMEPVTKTYPEKAFNELQASLVETQKVDSVTAVAGATASRTDFITLIKVALDDMAMSGTTEPKIIPAP